MLSPTAIIVIAATVAAPDLKRCNHCTFTVAKFVMRLDSLDQFSRKEACLRPHGRPGRSDERHQCCV